MLTERSLKLASILLGAVTTDRSSAFRFTPLEISGSTSIGSDISLILQKRLCNLAFETRVRTSAGVYEGSAAVTGLELH
jgi:hypothetical protein